MFRSGFVYLWFDKKCRKYYVGAHWGSQHDNYICSSDWMKRAYKRRPKDFKRRILCIITTSRSDLLKEEHRWLSMIKDNELKVKYYNLKNTYDNYWHTYNDLTVGQKISKALTGKKRGKRSAKAAAASKAGLRALYAKRRLETGTTRSLETRIKLSKGRRGKLHTEVHKARMSFKLCEIRADDQIWDKKHKKKCLYCGSTFVGRVMQKYCSVWCRGTRWRLSKEPFRVDVSVTR